LCFVAKVKQNHLQHIPYSCEILLGPLYCFHYFGAEQENFMVKFQIQIFLTLLFIAIYLACAMRPDPQYHNWPGKDEYEKEPSEITLDSDTLIFRNHGQDTEDTQELSQQDLVDNPELLERFKPEIQRFFGAPYVWGGASPRGTDCSGLVASIYKRARDKELPHSTKRLFQMGRRVRISDLEFGDLVFFNFKNRRSREPDHVGLYIADDYFLHASVSKGVTLANLRKSPYRDIFMGARRID
jgi:hypothetical protein